MPLGFNVPTTAVPTAGQPVIPVAGLKRHPVDPILDTLPCFWIHTPTVAPGDTVTLVSTFEAHTENSALAWTFLLPTPSVPELDGTGS